MARSRHRLTAIAGLALSAWLAATSGSALAEVHALVIGINDYDGPPKLKGAVNDAEDVAAALRANGASDVTVLVDREATREKAFAAWESMNGRSKPGDLLIFHFAGHGINVPDTDGDEEDGQDEAYLFAGFDEQRNPGELLVDDELDSWLAQAGANGRKVLFVADACHSGSPTRSVFGETLPTRFYRPRTQPERPLPLVAADATQGASRDYVFSVGATLDSRTVPEIMIGDAPRGALSYAVARAFEGAADLDHDGQVLASEFEAYVKQNVRSLAASKQTPQFEIPDEGFPIMTRIIEVVADTPTTVTADGAIRIHVRAGGDQALLDAVAGVRDIALVDDESTAHLVFDPASGSLANNVRDLIAKDLDRDGLLTAIEAQRALAALQRVAEHGTLPIAFSPDDEVQPEGTEIEFTVAGIGGRFLTIFDLTATGSIHFLYPTSPRDSDPITDDSLSIPARVTPPFGADNLVVLATSAPPTSLRDELRRLDGSRDPAALIAGIEAALAGQDYRIGMQAFFTRQK